MKITISENGEPHVQADFHIGLDMTDKWLSIAEMNAQKSIEAAKLLDSVWPSGDDGAAIPHLDAEFFHSIQGVCASAFSIDAFYTSIKEHIEIQPEMLEAWKKKPAGVPQFTGI